VKRWLFVLALGCAPAATSAPSRPPTAPATTSSPAASDPVQSAAVAAPEPDPRSEPARPEQPPLELSDEQLARAKKVQRHVRAAAAEYSLDPNLLNGVIWAESKFNPKARNRSGARGLMQMMPKTSKAMAQRIGRPHRPYDPAFSILAGASLLAGLRDKFDGDIELALFGYARGSGRVRKYQREGGEIPEGVLKFIARVRRAQRTFADLGFPAAG
jgi:soluble lytic murein transglycosylase-like protein